jgi:hypothetical protein
MSDHRDRAVNAVTREELAAQAVAVIRAHFSRPNDKETVGILESAIRQVSPVVPQKS